MAPTRHRNWRNDLNVAKASHTVAIGLLSGVTTTFLLEIGTEELPRFSAHALTQLDQRVRRDLKEARLSQGNRSGDTTPSCGQREDSMRVGQLREERKGLRWHRREMVFLALPRSASLRCGVDPADLEQRDTEGTLPVATVLTPGRSSARCARADSGLDRRAQGRRFMRWGTGGQRFSRPIRWLVALGDAVIRLSRWSGPRGEQ